MPYFITEHANETAPINLYKCGTLKECLKKFHEICSENNYDVVETETFPKTIAMREYSVEIYFHHKTK